MCSWHDPDRDEELRACEPPTHDHWRGERGGEGSNLGLVIERKVNQALREFARDARPPRVRGAARIPALDRWLGVFGGEGEGGGERGSRVFLIQGPEGAPILVEPLRRPTDPSDTIRARVSFRVALNPRAEPRRDTLKSRISVHAAPLDEDERIIGLFPVVDGEFTDSSSLVRPLRPGLLEGNLSQEWAEFQWESEPYERDSRLGCSVEVEY